ERKWDVTLVDQALSVLSISDRFCMKYVQERVLPYLMAHKFDSDKDLRVAALKKCFDLAARWRDDGEFVCWIFENCRTVAELYEVTQSCGTALSPHHMTTFCENLMMKHSSEIEEKEELIEELLKKNADLEARISQLIGRLGQSDTLVVLPLSATFPAAGGTSTHTLVNSADYKKCVVQVRYSVSISSGFIEAGDSVQLEITRNAPLAGSDRAHKLCIKFAPASEHATDARKDFESKTHTNESRQLEEPPQAQHKPARGSEDSWSREAQRGSTRQVQRGRVHF
ncbi:hypothetical protein PMAYCL1PPCAC_08971, partial [Pristionchus mayeri]